MVCSKDGAFFTLPYGYDIWASIKPAKLSISAFNLASNAICWDQVGQKSCYLSEAFCLNKWGCILKITTGAVKVCHELNFAEVLYLCT